GPETDASQRKWKPSFGSVRFLPIADTLTKRVTMLSQEEEGSDSEKKENENKVEEQKTPLITSVAQNKEHKSKQKNNGKSCEIQICVEEGSSNYQSSDMENSRIGGSQNGVDAIDSLSVLSERQQVEKSTMSLFIDEGHNSQTSSHINQEVKAPEPRSVALQKGRVSKNIPSSDAARAILR
ncbi:unnamed protein product, partial [Hymenolepis diminuta]